MLGVLLDQGFTAEPARKPVAFCRLLRVAALAVLIGHIITLSGAQAAAPADPVGHMLALVNGARAADGLIPLTLEPRLTAAACRQVRDLAQGGELTHQGRDGSDLGRRLTEAGYAFALAAENLAAGAQTADETVRLWLASPGHRRNIMTAEFRQAGIAYQRTGEVWVMVFGAAPSLSERQLGQHLPQPPVVNRC